MVNLTVGQFVAWLGCIFLLVCWLSFGKRKFVGFMLVVAGWSEIYAAIRSDGSLHSLLTIFFIGAFITALVVSSYTLYRVRSMAARSRGPRYIPTSRRGKAKRVNLAELE